MMKKKVKNKGQTDDLRHASTRHYRSDITNIYFIFGPHATIFFLRPPLFAPPHGRPLL